MTTRAGTLAALLAALGRPSWWILALAGFLVRGGILLFLLAVVSLPSPLALANVLGPIVTPLYLGTVSPTTVALIATGIVAIGAWVVAGGWFAAATEVVLIREARRAAADEGLPIGPELPPGRLEISRAATAHLLALVPFGLITAVASVQISMIAYRELINPSDGSPIVLRVVAAAWGPALVIAIAWVLGEIVGGIAVRRIVLGGQSLVRAVIGGAGDLVRHPVGALLAPLVTFAVLVVDLAAMLAVVTLVWTEVRSRLVAPLSEPVATGLTLLTLGAAWCLALLVTGLVDAWRSAALTFEVDRIAARMASSGLVADGTIGASTSGRPGDWSHDDGGGSL